MRRPPTAALPAAAAAVVAAVVVGGTAGDAAADLGVPVPSLSPLPSISVPPLPTSTPTVSLPVPTPSGSVSVPDPGLPGGSGGGGGSGSGSGGTSGGGVAGTASGTTSATAATTASGTGATTPAQRRKAERRKAEATPLVAGTAAADDLVDHESSPALFAASQDFLAADQAIAEIGRQKRLLTTLEQKAAEKAQLYRAMGYDIAGAEQVAERWHQRYDALATDTEPARLRMVGDSATRADKRLGELVVARQQVRADFERLADRYRATERALKDASARLSALASQRSAALEAMRAAGGGEAALHAARMAASGQLGSQIRDLSARLERRGDVVEGTGRMGLPLEGTVTSPYGMRFHPILHYTKLHTGTDFVGGGVIAAADDGRVLMTVFNSAYGYFTVIDHGDGLTTAYAHQARFLVEQGDVVRKGDPIGVVGSTGYSTGPHLHFEVREDGKVVDPMPFLAR
jgi:murein DD-endopeptidase MepM/ murein hydrolase activator NlpD